MNGAGGTVVTLANNSMVDGFWITPAPNGVYCNTTNSIISNNIIGGTSAQLIVAGRNADLILRNNIINGGSYGIIVDAESVGSPIVLIENNTIINNSVIAIYLQLASATTKIYLNDNIIANNIIGIVDANTSDTTHQHIFPSFNTYWNNTNGNFGELDPWYSTANNFNIMGPGDMDSDPMFVDASNNVHLLNGSQSINSGNPNARYNDPDDTRNDRGAYGGPTLNTPPDADFSIEPSQGSTGTIFTFDASLSHDGETKDERLQVRWDIDGDGTYDTVFETNKMFIHQYNLHSAL